MDSHTSQREDDIALVCAFLSAFQARELEKARHYLADDVLMQFPGAGPLQSLEEVVALARTRYRHASKTVHAIDHCVAAFGSVVVCHGVLSVTWREGTTTNGVRFIDRFEVSNGLIVRQDVWNDLALARRAAPVPTGDPIDQERAL